MRAVFGFLILWVLAVQVAAAPPPPQDPVLRIEAGMHTAFIRRIDVSADGKLLITGSEDKTARLWSLPDGELLRSFRLPLDQGEAGKVFAVAITPDGKQVAVAGYDLHEKLSGEGAFIYLFDTASGSLARRIGPLNEGVYDLDFSPDGSRLAAGLYGEHGVRVWMSPFDGAPKKDNDYAAGIYGLAFDSNNHLYVTAQDGLIRHYDEAFAGLARVASHGQREITDVDVSPDGARIAMSYADEPRIDVLDADSLLPLFSVDVKGISSGNLGFAAWSADGQTLYGGGTYFDSTDTFPVFAWNDGGKAKRRQIGQSTGNIFDLAALPDGGVVAAASDPAFMVLDPKGIERGLVTADMREKLGEKFLVSRDGTQVRFGFDSKGTDNYIFDATTLTLAPSRERPGDFIPAETQMLPVRDWEDTRNPTVAGNPVAFDAWDMSRSLAIAHGAKTFVLGSSFRLSKLDKVGGLLWRKDMPSISWGVNLSEDDGLVISAGGDGTIRWHEALEGAELLSLFVHVPTKRWIAWTPEGYFAASPGAEDLIGWHVNGKTWNEAPKFYPASRFRDQFYRPDIIALVLKLRSERAAVEQANSNAGRKEGQENIESLLPATVDILVDAANLQAAGPDVAIPYRVSSPTGRAVTRIEARIDGRPVATRGFAALEEEVPVDAPLVVNVSVPPRDSVVTLIPFIGEQPGVAATIAIKWVGQIAVERKPKLFALLVGVSDYANPDLKLSYAAKDAADFAQALKAQEGGFYESVDIESLLDRQASKSSVETALAKLRKKVGPDDMAIVFLAGHGMTDAAFDFFYLTADSDMDADLLAATAVGGDTIRKGLARIPGKVVLFMDTCRSGAGIEGRVDMSRAANDFAQEAGGLVMFASSQGREVSFERSDWGNGAFTEALLAIIADAKFYGDDGKLSIPELEEAVTARVAELTDGRQNAGMTKYGAAPRFFIAGLR